MVTMSPEEVEREHREKLGDEFGGVYYALYTEVALASRQVARVLRALWHQS
jgi:hypothetical protein